MAEEDEVDVLGDFNLGNLLSKNACSLYDGTSLVSQNSDLLNCDYTIHPQWLLDRPSANPDNWYDINPSAQAESDALGLVSTENCITDESGWTEKEKNLLERGIEIFGKSNVRLSQFIGSKTASEVKYYLKNFYLENHNNKNLNEGCIDAITSTNLVADVLDDTQIPASIEEVIAAVSTAKPTVQTNNPKSRTRTSSFYNSETGPYEYKDIPSGQSLLKTNHISKLSESIIKEPNEKLKKYSFKKTARTKAVRLRFKTKFREPATKENTNHVLKQKVVKIMNEQSQKAELSKVEITTGKGLAVPICEGEEIVKLKKVQDDSESETEIDVELSDEECITKNISQAKPKLEPKLEPVDPIYDNPQITTSEELETNANDTKQPFDLSTLDDNTLKQLTSLDEPQCEVMLKEDEISELEKVVHYMYFEGNPCQTPARYLKIRNHIINNWLSHKPNYLKKTLSRYGLKNCGDVNSIGRIHQFLEQIGVINFGCGQVRYSRPLSEMIQLQPPSREKSSKDAKNLIRPISDLGSRQRFKKKFNNDGEGGCTLTHDESGHVINTTVVNEEPVVKHHRPYVKKPTIRLIYCRPFTDEKPQPYTIKIHLSTLLTVDFHAHLSLTEVMGLVAGYWIPQDQTLTIIDYEPCLNIASSSTHCDMCPISQAKASESIHDKGLDILGWFHSHPTFAPEPSQQDLETQRAVQQWIGYNKPCIGVILSPFGLNAALIASPFRCMVVDKKVNFEDQFVPYKFFVEVVAENFKLHDFVENLRKVLRSDIGCSTDSRIDFSKPYFQDPTISYLQKYITSVRMHLAKCGTLSKMTCDRIIQAITAICHGKT